MSLFNPTPLDFTKSTTQREMEGKRGAAAKRRSISNDYTLLKGARSKSRRRSC